MSKLHKDCILSDSYLVILSFWQVLPGLPDYQLIVVNSIALKGALR